MTNSTPYGSAKDRYTPKTPTMNSFHLSTTNILHRIVNWPAAYLVSSVQEVVALAKEELKPHGETTKSLRKRNNDVLWLRKANISVIVQKGGAANAAGGKTTKT